MAGIRDPKRLFQARSRAGSARRALLRAGLWATAIPLLRRRSPQAPRAAALGRGDDRDGELELEPVSRGPTRVRRGTQPGRHSRDRRRQRVVRRHAGAPRLPPGGSRRSPARSISATSSRSTSASCSSRRSTPSHSMSTRSRCRTAGWTNCSRRCGRQAGLGGPAQPRVRSSLLPGDPNPALRRAAPQLPLALPAAHSRARCIRRRRRGHLGCRGTAGLRSSIRPASAVQATSARCSATSSTTTSTRRDSGQRRRPSWTHTSATDGPHGAWDEAIARYGSR